MVACLSFKAGFAASEKQEVLASVGLLLGVHGRRIS
jgi:hypothetical protein